MGNEWRGSDRRSGMMAPDRNSNSSLACISTVLVDVLTNQPEHTYTHSLMYRLNHSDHEGMITGCNDAALQLQLTCTQRTRAVYVWADEKVKHGFCVSVAVPIASIHKHRIEKNKLNWNKVRNKRRVVH